MNLITTILDVLIMFAALWALDRILKASGKKGIFDRYRKFIFKEKDVDAEAGVDLDYPDLFKKFLSLTNMTPLDVFLTCRTEKGFGHSDDKVRHHLSWYTKTGELPNYVESFLEDGRNFIINA